MLRGRDINPASYDTFFQVTRVRLDKRGDAVYEGNLVRHTEAGYYQFTGLSVGTYDVLITIPGGDGGAQGDLDWRDYLSDGENIIQKEIVVNPMGPDRPQLCPVRLPGAMNANYLENL